jgi:hypothetical protein
MMSDNKDASKKGKGRQPRSISIRPEEEVAMTALLVMSWLENKDDGAYRPLAMMEASPRNGDHYEN